MLDNFSNVRKIPILSHHLLISGKSFTDFTGVNISLMVIFLYQPLFNVIFIVLIKCHVWKKVSCFFMVFYLKLLFEAVQYWTVLYFSFEKDTPTWVMPELYLPHNLLSAFFYKYPWKHIQHKRILDSQCLILGKYCRNIYFFFNILSNGFCTIICNKFLFEICLRKVLHVNPFSNMHTGRLPCADQIKFISISVSALKT